MVKYSPIPDSLAAKITASDVNMTDLQHLRAIGVVGQSQSIADVLALPESSWFVRLVASAGHWGGLQKTSKEIGDLFKDQGACGHTANLNNLKNCPIIIDDQNNRFWVHGGQLLPVLNNGNNGYVIKYQDRMYAPVNPNGYFKTPQLKEHPKSAFQDGDLTYFDVNVQEALVDVCYVDKGGALITAQKGSYIVSYERNSKSYCKVVVAAEFAKCCKLEAELSNVNSNAYFTEKLQYKKASNSFDKIMPVYDLFIARANADESTVHIPNVVDRLANSLSKKVGFTSYNMTKNSDGVLISGKYKYASVGGEGDTYYDVAEFTLQTDAAGVIVSATITSKGTSLLSYAKGEPMKI